MANDELNFLQFLQGFRRGDLVREADALMGELMQAIQDTGGKGKLVLELPFGVNKAGQIECVPKMKVDKPLRPIGTGIFYLSDDARLSRRDPNQHEMFDEMEERRGSGVN